MRPTTRELSVLDYLAGDLSKDVLVHLAHLGRTTPAARKTGGSSQMPGGPTPVASVGGPQWKATAVYHLTDDITMLVPREVAPLPLHVSRQCGAWRAASHHLPLPLLASRPPR